jgi:hypothetical protein
MEHVRGIAQRARIEVEPIVMVTESLHDAAQPVYLRTDMGEFECSTLC